MKDLSIMDCFQGTMGNWLSISNWGRLTVYQSRGIYFGLFFFYTLTHGVYLIWIMVYPPNINYDMYAFVLFCAGWILIPLYVRHICILIDTEVRPNQDRRETEDGGNNDKRETEDGGNHDRRETKDSGNHDRRETDVGGNHDRTKPGGSREQQSGETGNIKENQEKEYYNNQGVLSTENRFKTEDIKFKLYLI